MPINTFNIDYTKL